MQLLLKVEIKEWARIFSKTSRKVLLGISKKYRAELSKTEPSLPNLAQRLGRPLNSNLRTEQYQLLSRIPLESREKVCLPKRKKKWGKNEKQFCFYHLIFFSFVTRNSQKKLFVAIYYISTQFHNAFLQQIRQLLGFMVWKGKNWTFSKHRIFVTNGPGFPSTKL